MKCFLGNFMNFTKPLTNIVAAQTVCYHLMRPSNDNTVAGSAGRAVEGVALKSLDYWEGGFETR
jgi:hypothetical protein